LVAPCGYKDTNKVRTSVIGVAGLLDFSVGLLLAMMSKDLYDQAACKNMETDMFFKTVYELEIEGIPIKTLRRVCASCPIRVQCTEYAFQHEQYGTWGALTQEERILIRANNWANKSLTRLSRELSELGINIAEIIAMSRLKPQFYSSGLHRDRGNKNV
jgi:hypothetical protein